MKKPPPQTRILEIIVSPLVFGSVILAFIDPSTWPMFNDLTKIVAVTYIGLHIPPSDKGQPR